MKKVVSIFFHRIGVFFSFFVFIVFFLTLSCDLQKFLWQDILILLLGPLFIYVFSRFIGWVVNVIIKS